MQARGHSHSLPCPWGAQEGVKLRFQELVEAPPGALTLLIHSTPYIAERRAHGVFNAPLIYAFALHRDFRQLAALFAPSLISMNDTLPSFHRERHLPATAIQCESHFSTARGS